MAISPPRDMTVIVDLPRLIASGCETEPGADGTGLLEVVRVLNGGREAGRGHRPDARDGHQKLARLAFACVGDQLTSELGGTQAHAAPRLQDRQHDCGEIILIDQQRTNMLFELAALASRDDQPESLHQPSDLVGWKARS